MKSRLSASHRRTDSTDGPARYKSAPIKRFAWNARTTSHPERRQKKITIGEVRAAGVRGVLIYCTPAAATGPTLTPIGGLMTSGSRTSRAVWLAQLAAGAALTFGRTGSGYQLS